jgi:hypothetical protein
LPRGVISAPEKLWGRVCKKTPHNIIDIRIFIIIIARYRRRLGRYATKRKVPGSSHEEAIDFFLIYLILPADPLCGLVVRVPGYRSRGHGSIPGSARFSEK